MELKKIKRVAEIYHKVGLNCSNRAMYGIRDEIMSMAQKIDDELYDTSFSSFSDYEGDLEKIVFYYNCCNENHIKIWKQICEKYNIEFDEKLDHSIHLTIFN